MRKSSAAAPHSIVCGMLAGVLAASNASAHHSPAPFDLGRTVELEGVVTQFSWAAPHVYIDIEVSRPSGESAIYEVEALWPAALIPYGWSRDTLEAGDRVRVTGNPGRADDSLALLGRSLVVEGRSEPLVLNVFPGTAAPYAGPGAEDRSELEPAAALIGAWQPTQTFDFLEAFAVEPLLTEEGRAAADTLAAMNPQEGSAARCVPHSPPFNMIFQEAKRFEARGNDFLIRLAVDGDVERIIQMGDSRVADDPADHQGRSRGRWEGDTLVVETTFEDIENGAAVDVGGVPALDTRLLEQFALSESRKEIAYSYSIENAAYLTQPIRGFLTWGFNAGLDLPRLECDPEVASRFVAQLPEQTDSDTRAVSAGDTRIEYVVSGPEDGEPILLIHGALLGRAFGLVQERLTEHGHRVIRIHRRGFEDSSVDAPPQSESGHAADAVAVLDDLDVETAHVVGHSSGAWIALRVLLETPGRVQSLTMVDPAVLPGLFTAQPDAIQAELLGPAFAAFQSGDAETGLQTFSRAVFGDDWREFFDAFPGGYEQALTDAMRLVWGAPPPRVVDPAQVIAMGRPIRVLWAGENEGSAAAAELADSLPTAEVGFIGGTDHALITQKPDEVARDISAFVERVSN